VVQIVLYRHEDESVDDRRHDPAQNQNNNATPHLSLITNKRKIPATQRIKRKKHFSCNGSSR